MDSKQEKVSFTFTDTNENTEFYVIEQTKLNGVNYLLVTESNEEEAEAFILKQVTPEEEENVIYNVVEDDLELENIAKIFGELLEDIDIEL